MRSSAIRLSSPSADPNRVAAQITGNCFKWHLTGRHQCPGSLSPFTVPKPEPLIIVRPLIWAPGNQWSPVQWLCVACIAFSTTTFPTARLSDGDIFISFACAPGSVTTLKIDRPVVLFSPHSSGTLPRTRFAFLVVTHTKHSWTLSSLSLALSLAGCSSQHQSLLACFV